MLSMYPLVASDEFHVCSCQTTFLELRFGLLFFCSAEVLGPAGVDDNLGTLRWNFGE